jgi:hypothetical protein
MAYNMSLRRIFASRDTNLQHDVKTRLTQHAIKGLFVTGMLTIKL